MNLMLLLLLSRKPELRGQGGKTSQPVAEVRFSIKIKVWIIFFLLGRGRGRVNIGGKKNVTVEELDAELDAWKSAE